MVVKTIYTLLSVVSIRRPFPSCGNKGMRRLIMGNYGKAISMDCCECKPSHSRVAGLTHRERLSERMNQSVMNNTTRWRRMMSSYKTIVCNGIILVFIECSRKDWVSLGPGDCLFYYPGLSRAQHGRFVRYPQVTDKPPCPSSWYQYLLMLFPLSTQK